MAPSRRRRGPHRPWSDGLPPELLGLVLLHLHCLADRVYFAAVCRAWRAAAGALDAPPRSLPCLLLPSRHAPSFFSLHSGATRRLYLREGAIGARLCGSHDGGWVVAAVDPWQGYAAINIFSRVRVPLPDRLRVTRVLPNMLHETSTLEHRMVIRTVTFSAAPTAEDCLAAAHVCSGSNIAFWRPGMDGHWLAYQRDVDGFEDIIYHESEAKQGFHVLNNTEDVLVYTPQGDRHAPLELLWSFYHVQKRVDYLSDQLKKPKSFSMSRYLVESRGKLLMVLRMYSSRSRVRQRTWMCRIFEMKLEILPQGGFNASWVELYDLRGRVIFLGRGCSRAFEVSQFNGLQEGVIYYLDDTSFDLSLVLNNASKYSITDTGMCAVRKFGARSQRLPREFTSDCSPPIWIIN